VPVGRTTIVLDEDLVKQAMLVTGTKTKRQAVDALRKLEGKMPWDGEVDAWRRVRR
jgi:Arc/MetJ family transcription regulator